MIDSTDHIDLLFSSLRDRPGAPAFTLGEVTLSFGELDARARAYAGGLKALGVGKGDRVASWLDTSLEMIVALVGHYLLGAVHVPVNTRYGEVEVGHILGDSGASVVLVDGADRLEVARRLVGASARVVCLGGARAKGEREVDFEDLIASEAPVEGAPPGVDEDAALFIYTSGTTGRSKGVVLPYRAVVSGIDALTRLWRFVPEDVLVLALPLFHVHGLCIGVHGTLIRGNRALLHERFDVDRVIEAMSGEGTVFMGVPTMHTRLVRALERAPERGEALGQARLFTSGSAALSADLFERFEALTGHRILERYGMSETLLTVSNPYEPERRRPGTIGFPVPGCEVEIVDEAGQRCPAGVVGELVVRGPTLMREYWGAPKMTRAAMREGWFLTGDAARYDEDGYIVHVGRRSVDILKSGGYKISAREIEEVLARHPEVSEVGVVGIPDDEWGQRIGAALVPVEGASRELEYWRDAVAAHVDGALADYKRPREVIVMDQLPRNALGKLQKHRILAAIASRT